ASIGLAGAGSVASANVSAGAQALNLAGLSVSNSNYTVTGGSGTVQINPAAIIVTAMGGTSVYGSQPANPGLSATGLQNGENVGVLTGLSNSFGITSSSSVADSPYMLTVVGVLSNPNYTVTTRIAGIWTVTAAPSVEPARPVNRTAIDGFDPPALPDAAKPVFATLDPGAGMVNADPRFDQAYICFGGGGGMAQMCSSGR
ncbi:hypothetical protein SAMN05216304_1121, partial [Bosea sp. OK403]|uniref:MBG domain-containing protein n=1 Tax=Bosea sp. OK403 TaxID=1855286 RepID=UPI0008EF04C5